MRLLIPVGAITLWIATFIYSLIVLVWPVEGLAPLQRIVTTAAAVLTLMWWMDRCGLEYRVGYRHGRKNKNRGDRDW